MTRRHRAPAGALLTLAAVLVIAAPAPAAVSVRGTVVHRNARTQSFVVASATGHLTKVRSRYAARLGRAVRVSGRRMRDGSLDATSVRTGVRDRVARLRGTVTFASRRSGRFTVSSAAGSISVRHHRAGRAGAAAADDDMPAVGTQVVVTITVQANGVLDEDEIDEVGEDEGEIEVEGRVKSLDLAAHTVTISASDDDASGGTVTVGFPATFDLSRVAVSNDVELEVARQADGTFVLRKLESEDENELEDEADDDNGARPPGDDNDDRGED
jgi:hypothetical protein